MKFLSLSLLSPMASQSDYILTYNKREMAGHLSQFHSSDSKFILLAHFGLHKHVISSTKYI